MADAPRYRTIVADPPWPIGAMPAWFREEDRTARENELGCNPTPYSTMSVDEIAALPVKDWAEGDRWHVNGARGGCNLFLWTTTEFLCAAHEVAKAWRRERVAATVLPRIRHARTTALIALQDAVMMCCAVGVDYLDVISNVEQSWGFMEGELAVRDAD